MNTPPAPSQRPRPLSPHLQIYKPQLTSVLSITHRLCGMVLVGAALMITIWVCSAAYGRAVFEAVNSVITSWFGILVMAGFTFALFYHLGNGIRHLVWDAGYGYDIPTLYKSGYAVIAFSLIASVATWLYALYG